jgi:hypothetical protein
MERTTPCEKNNSNRKRIRATKKNSNKEKSNTNKEKTILMG